eukprot:1195584-Pyramimonas_sp.AAC.1
MREYWQQQWDPQDTPDQLQARHEAWRGYARIVAFLTPERLADWVPSLGDSLYVLGRAKGASGMNGRTGAETKLLKRLHPEGICELYELCVEISSACVA